MINAAGLMLVDPKGRALFVRRSGSGDHGGEWAFPGGRIEDGEVPLGAARRELSEECGGFADDAISEEPTQLHAHEHEGVNFTTFHALVRDPFVPNLEGEHDAFAWMDPAKPPSPLHPGVERVLAEHNKPAMDERPLPDLVLRDGHIFFANHPELGGFTNMLAVRERALGMDEAPNRTISRDGAMHVRDSNISKANVCEYYGREIPRHVQLGLDPNKKYRLLRHPDELKKAVPTFNNLPILAKHVPVTAADHQPHLIIGTTGTDAAYQHPYMKNSTAFWAGGAVNAINSEAMRELSSAYHYDPDMTPGEYEGEAYDGVMRNIVGNHVALVREGRAGDDIVVGDSKPEELYMTNKVLSRTALFAAGATSVLLASKMAMDAKPIDTSSLFEGVTNKNFKDMKPKVLERARAALKGITLAQDAKLEDVIGMLDKMEQPQVKEGADADPDTGAPLDAATLQAAMMDPGAADLDVDTKRREFLAGKLGAEDMAAWDALCAGTEPPAKDEDLDEEGKPKLEKEVKLIDKPAMDAAIQTAVNAEKARGKAIRTAELAVEPWVGKLAMAFDSAPEVYGKALQVLGVTVAKGTHPDALPAILAAQPKPGARPAPREHVLAMDGAPSSDFNARFPGADRIGAA